MHLISVMGVTNTGKSTLLTEAAKLEDVGLIEVGKELRRRHPPEYFNGFAAMKHTEDEAWEIFDEQYAAAEAAGCRVCLVDGQPRMVEQVKRIIMYGKNRKAFGGMERSFSAIILYADRGLLDYRAKHRDADNERALELNMKRLSNDFEQLLPVLATMLEFKDRIANVATFDTGYSIWLEAAIEFIKECRAC